MLEMFLMMLPSTVETKIAEDTEITTLAAALKRARKMLVRKTDQRLAIMQDTKLQQTLRQGFVSTSMAPVNAALDAQKLATDITQNAIAQIGNRFKRPGDRTSPQQQPPQRQQQPPQRPPQRTTTTPQRTPDATWKDGACFECGEHGHHRWECPKLKDIIARSGNGKTPIGHQSAYDKAHGIAPSTKEKDPPQKPSWRVSAIGDAHAHADDEELQAEFEQSGLQEEYISLGAAILPIGSAPSRCCPVSGPCFFPASANEHVDEGQDDVEGEELQVVAALERKASPKRRMKPMPKVPQRTRKEQQPLHEVVPEVTPELVAELAGKLEKGEITLPSSKKGKKWSLADSGSRPHIANAKRHFPGAKIRPSKEPGASSGYTAANGTHIENQGEFEVKYISSGGHKRSIVFQNADVQIPITSTGRMADADFETTYRKHDGIIHHLPTGQKDRFIRAHGVYWIEMNVVDDFQPPSPTPTPPKPEGVHRPGK